jgi:hypothetical protein
LHDILPEGVIYAYNIVAPMQDFAVEAPGSTLRVVGVAMVRHGWELSMLLLAAETPPFPADEDVSYFTNGGVPALGKEELAPDPSYTLESRYVPGMPGHARVIMLTRFDLKRARYDVRYVNLDVGKAYDVLSDDPQVMPKKTDPVFAASANAGLNRYSGLFSAAACLIYLPAFLIDQGSRVVESRFATELQVRGAKLDVREAVKILGVAQVPFFRVVRCLTGATPAPDRQGGAVSPPDLEFESSGYWKPLGPSEIGENADGNPIVGKTWVERTDSWSAKPLSAFVVSMPSKVRGADPGFVYVMRSGSHHADLYKVGLTRRSTQTRASEVGGATGVPTGFEVLAQWEVGDCTATEKEVHIRLAALRVNKRREFFRGSLQGIIQTINHVVNASKANAI